jgi:hypothetical protein
MPMSGQHDGAGVVTANDPVFHPIWRRAYAGLDGP